MRAQVIYRQPIICAYCKRIYRLRPCKYCIAAGKDGFSEHTCSCGGKLIPLEKTYA